MTSLYEIFEMTLASGTRRGSALKTPQTSVQIVISNAFNNFPKIDAVKSLPSLFKVVATPNGVDATKPVITIFFMGEIEFKYSLIKSFDLSQHI